MGNAIGWIISFLVVVGCVIAVLAWFYQRATREVSLVKTGLGGRRVVMDGGVLAIPYFTEVSRVNMQTLRLAVRRAGEAALITRDRLRVDVGVEFYVSVIADQDGVARAAQTIGRRTFHPDQLRELIEGKLVDALRSVAAKMSMDELHEQRGAFVAEVRAGLVESLARNGLELDSVSLTALDQTPFTALDENNAFNAVGMRKLAEVIATSKKERAQIDADAEVSVRKAAMEANKQKLQIDLDEQEAQIAQVQQIEGLKATQVAEVARRKAASEQAAAQARIAMEREIRAAEIAKERQLQEAEIARDREVAVAEQQRQIVVAEKSREESQARAAADAARIETVTAAEAVTTARLMAEAERRRSLALLAARQEAESDATRLRLAAEAERAVAGDRAEARRVASEAHKRAQLAEAEARRAVIDAENMQSESLLGLRVDLARLEALPKIVAEMVKPAKKIDSIRIHHLSGLSGRTHSDAEQAAKPVLNQALDSIMEMAVQLPALKKIGEQVGLSMEGGVSGVTDSGLGDKPGSGKQAKD